MTVLDNRALLLKVERDLETLQDQFDRHGEEGDEVTNVLLVGLRQDWDSMFERITTLEVKVGKLQRIVTELLSA